MIKEDSKNIILHTALEIIEKEGFEKLTVRKIVDKTGKNLNAINYYFGSKEQLEIEAIKYFFDIVYNRFFTDESKNYSMEEFLNSYCEMILENRDLFKKIFSCLISDNSEIVNKVSEYVNGKIGKVISKIETDRVQTVEEKMRYFQKMAGIIYPVLIIEGVKNMFGFDLADKDIRKKYINILANQ